MLIVDFDWPPPWYLDAIETGDITPPPLPTGILYSPQISSHQETKMEPVELNDRHLRSHGKIGDCEPSTHHTNTSLLRPLYSGPNKDSVNHFFNTATQLIGLDFCGRWTGLTGSHRDEGKRLVT